VVVISSVSLIKKQEILSSSLWSRPE